MIFKHQYVFLLMIFICHRFNSLIIDYYKNNSSNRIFTHIITTCIKDTGHSSYSCQSFINHFHMIHCRKNPHKSCAKDSIMFWWCFAFCNAYAIKEKSVLRSVCNYFWSALPFEEMKMFLLQNQQSAKPKVLTQYSKYAMKGVKPSNKIDLCAQPIVCTTQSNHKGN